MPTPNEILIAERQADLVQVKAAISAAYSGQEYEIEAGQSRRKLKRQPLNVLLGERARLEREIAELMGLGRGRVSHGMPV